MSDTVFDAELGPPEFGRSEAAPRADVPSWLKPHKRIGGWAARDPYARYEKKAEFIKARAQMLLGVGLALVLVVRLFAAPFGMLDTPSWLHDFLGHPPLEFVSWGLMYAAGVELAYMLFTKGPDEAIQPLMLGLASSVLLLISDGVEDWRDALLVPAFIVSLAILFFMDHFYRSSRQQLEFRASRSETVGTGETEGRRETLST